jgi:hypothetical protein
MHLRLRRSILSGIAGLAVALAWPAAGHEDGPPALKVGEKVPEISGLAVPQNQNRSITYPKGRTTVLLLFLPDCPHCHKMIPEWNRAFARKPANVEVVGLMLAQEPPGFFGLFPISFPVIRYPGRDAQASFKMQRVPMMVRVGAGGVVQDVAHGVIDPIRLGEIFKP